MERVSVAIDIGGVILDINNTQSELIPLMSNTLSYLNKLKEKYNLFLLSFCGKKTEVETREVLKIYKINEIIDETNWIFVRKTKHKKIQMINHNIKLLIDDRESIIQDVNSDNNLIGLLFEGWNEELLNKIDELIN